MHQRHLGHDLELAAEVQQEGPVGDVPDGEALRGVHRRPDLLPVLLARPMDGDVHRDVVAAGLGDVERLDGGTGLGDDVGQPGRRAEVGRPSTRRVIEYPGLGVAMGAPG